MQKKMKRAEAANLMSCLSHVLYQATTLREAANETAEWMAELRAIREVLNEVAAEKMDEAFDIAIRIEAYFRPEKPGKPQDALERKPAA